MFKNMRLVILFDMLLNPSFKISYYLINLKSHVFAVSHIFAVAVAVFLSLKFCAVK